MKNIKDVQDYIQDYIQVMNTEPDCILVTETELFAIIQEHTKLEKEIPKIIAPSGKLIPFKLINSENIIT